MQLIALPLMSLFVLIAEFQCRGVSPERIEPVIVTALSAEDIYDQMSGVHQAPAAALLTLDLVRELHFVKFLACSVTQGPGMKI